MLLGRHARRVSAQPRYKLLNKTELFVGDMLVWHEHEGASLKLIFTGGADSRLLVACNWMAADIGYAGSKLLYCLEDIHLSAGNIETDSTGRHGFRDGRYVLDDCPNRHGENSYVCFRN